MPKEKKTVFNKLLPRRGVSCLGFRQTLGVQGIPLFGCKSMKKPGKALRLNNGELIHPEYYKKMRSIIDQITESLNKQYGNRHKQGGVSNSEKNL